MLPSYNCLGKIRPGHQKITTVQDTHRQNAPVETNIIKGFCSGYTWTHLAAQALCRIFHRPALATLAPLRDPLRWLITSIIIFTSL